VILTRCQHQLDWIAQSVDERNFAALAYVRKSMSQPLAYGAHVDLFPVAGSV
jgi:hypothetical protein